MPTSLQCVAKADEMDVLALGCPHPGDQAAFVEMAAEWRRTAIVARRQERWAALHPEG